MERRGQVPDRRQGESLQTPAERRAKTRRRLRKFHGSPPADDLVIDLNDEDVVRYWATELDVSADELKSVVQNVGATVKAVREHFGK